MSINIFDYLTKLDEQRYRAIIIHAIPSKSPAMSVYSEKVCARTNGRYVDLLDYFIQTQNLSEKIDTFSPEKLLELLTELSTSQTLTFFDRMDFLLDTWSKSERQDFYRMVDNQWDGFKQRMRSKLVFCLQTSQEMESLVIKDSTGNSRIFELSDFNDIN